MRDKQAFEAFVLEKSRARKQEIQRRRKTMLTTGMSLCICLIVVVCVTAVWKPTPGTVTATPAVESQRPTAIPIEPEMNGVPATDDEDLPGDAMLPQATMQPSAPQNTPLLSAPPQATAPVDDPVSEGTSTTEALPLDEAFARGATDCALPDKIEVEEGVEIRGVDKIRQICDWILQHSDMHAGNGADVMYDTEIYTLRMYYAEKTVTCYLDSGNALFRMEDGPWLTVDAADVEAFTGFFVN